MKVEDLFDEIAPASVGVGEQVDNADYEVVVELGGFLGHQKVKSVRWEHADKQAVIELES